MVNKGAPAPLPTPSAPLHGQHSPQVPADASRKGLGRKLFSTPVGANQEDIKATTAHEQELTHLIIRAPFSVNAKGCALPTHEAKPNRRKILMPGMRPRRPAGQRAWGVTRARGARERGLHWKLHEKNDALPSATWKTELTSSRMRREE